MKNQDAKSILKGSTEWAAMAQLTSNMPKKLKLENSKIISLKFRETVTAKLEFCIQQSYLSRMGSNEENLEKSKTEHFPQKMYQRRKFKGYIFGRKQKNQMEKRMYVHG